MIEAISEALHSQFDAALSMLVDCIRTCPDDLWDRPIARYPFWQVAYHTLCFADLYLTPDEAQFQPHAMHPAGWREFDDEYPSRWFDREELLAYEVQLRHKAMAVFAAESSASLEGPSGHRRLAFSRAQLHIYNIRHIQHHTGQLSAFLRRIDPSMQSSEYLRWAKSARPA